MQGGGGIYIHLSRRGEGVPTLMALVNKSIDSANCPHGKVPVQVHWQTLIVIDWDCGRSRLWKGGRWGSWYIEHYVLCMSASNCRVAAHSHQRIPTCMQRSLSFPLSFSSFFSHLSLPTRLSFVLIILHKKLIISISVFFFLFFVAVCRVHLV